MKDVFECDLPILVDVQLLIVCSLDESLSELVDVSSQGDEELIKTDFSVLISVEGSEQELCFVLRHSDAEIDESPSEIVDVELPVTTVIHSSEDPAESSDAE